MIVDNSIEQRKGNRVALIIGVSLLTLLILAMVFS